MNEVERGTGRKLLLVHGLGGSWRSWSTVLGPLSAERRVITIDLPGHGATPAESDSGTFDGLVGSVERYISDKGLDGIDVVGSSMGARIVLELARRGRVGNVVALDPGGFWRGWERTFFRTTIGVSGAVAAGDPAGFADAKWECGIAHGIAGTVVGTAMGARSESRLDGTADAKHDTNLRYLGP